MILKTVTIQIENNLKEKISIIFKFNSITIFEESSNFSFEDYKNLISRTYDTKNNKNRNNRQIF